MAYQTLPLVLPRVCKIEATRPRCILHLMYVAIDKSEFCITPVGKPPVSGSFSNPGQVRDVVLDVHTACTATCVATTGSLTMKGAIDIFSACRFRCARYICRPRCVSPRVDQTYTPDDWHAFVLLVNCLVFRTTSLGF